MYGYGPGGQANLNLNTDQVKTYLQQMIRNPNLMVGDIKEKDIVTKQGNQLVQRLDFNRHNGFVQPEQ
jgi:predicted transcriptional regulator